ncbi:MAG: antA/AntB antirepressor family protein [Cetobacterium sp.]|uniref:antA/AntB antirepressor family protein n=1 Tax=Cetobacterium sp. TaxID=2071632 RepID=UPI003F3D8BDD
MELIKVSKNKKNEQVVSARELHSFLEIKKDFSDWIKTYVGNEIYGFEKDLDYTTFEGNSTKSTPRPRIEYILTTDMAKQLCMLSKVDKGREARKYFIECERKLKENSLKKDLVYAIYEGGEGAIEAHKILVEMEVEEAVKPVQEKLDVKTTELDTAITQINNLITLGKNTTFDINVASKLLGYEGMGERNLFKFMRENKWINLNNTPSQSMVANGRAVSVLKHNRHMNVDYHQTRLTIKGLFWVGNKLRESGYETFVTDDMLIRQIEELMPPSEIVDNDN